MRADANPIAFRAVRALLEAAHDFQFTAAGQRVEVRVQVEPGPGWPEAGIAGLDPAALGDFPDLARAHVRWSGGQMQLVVGLDWWRTGKHDSYHHLVGVAARVPSTGRELLWVTFGKAIRDAADGERARILGKADFNSLPGEAPEAFRAHAARLRAMVHEAGLPRSSPARAILAEVSLPDAALHPSAAVAFERVVILAALKAQLMLRDGTPGIEGERLVGEAEPPPSEVDRAEVGPAERRYASVLPLPGGVRAYKQTLDALLGELAERSLSREGFAELLAESYDVSGVGALNGYWRQLCWTGLAVEVGGSLALSEAGQAYLDDPSAERLFAAFDARFLGVFDSLAFAALSGPVRASELTALLNQRIGNGWRTNNQASFRLNWLLSMGLLERGPRGDVVTPAGEVLLAARRLELEALRATLTAPQPDETERDELEAIEVSEDEDAEQGPAGWLAERLDLSAERAQATLGELVLSRATLEQACAALSSGKHLLLVGPPGTGKTVFAHALARAAQAEGYCEGLFSATASADWTTFDTIGGYALMKDRSLSFRPGAFLKAIERRQWLLIDELNRADVDRAFGELMTVLSGKGTDTPFLDDAGRTISIGPEEGRTHRVPKPFRVLATMNTWDKTSLFRLSYAVQRRFATLHLGLPEPAVYAALLEERANRLGYDVPLDPGMSRVVQELFSPEGLLQWRQIGPAVALDVVRYMRRRGARGEALAEALGLFLLAQLEGLALSQAQALREYLVGVLTSAGASGEAIAELERRLEELFPTVEV